MITIDLLYGDQEGGQRTVSRFTLMPMTNGQPIAMVSRQNLDRSDPLNEIATGPAVSPPPHVCSNNRAVWSPPSSGRRIESRVAAPVALPGADHAIGGSPRRCVRRFDTPCRSSETVMSAPSARFGTSAKAPPCEDR